MGSSTPPMTAPPASPRHATVFVVLDRWRIVLALIVVALHAASTGLLPWHSDGVLRRVAHDAVIGFFVISGYSVMHSAASHAGRPQAFLAARMSRLWSVAVPGLFLTLALDLVGRSVRPDLYPGWMYDLWWLHLPFHALFLGESWLRSYAPFSNVPWWSLAYEAWYYVLLAATMLPRGHRGVASAVVLLAMGPRIWLLLPCWLLGVWAWHCVQRGRLPALPRLAWPGALLAIAYLAWISTPLYPALRAASEGVSAWIAATADPALRLRESRWFLADWFTATVFAGAVIASAARIGAARAGNPRWVGSLAFHAFGIYLLHYPLLLLAAALGADRQPVGVRALVVVAVVGACVAASAVFERTRRRWRDALMRRL
jgi:peptidoglycan/LPS O-acetylase OafA/YrhL